MYLCAKMIDLVGGEGDRSMRGLWGRMDEVVAWWDGGCSKRNGNLWDIGKGTVNDGCVTVCQLTTGVAYEESSGGK